MRYNPMLASTMSRLPMVDVRPGEWMAEEKFDADVIVDIMFS